MHLGVDSFVSRVTDPTTERVIGPEERMAHRKIAATNPLVFNGTKLIPSVTHVFKRAQTLHGVPPFSPSLGTALCCAGSSSRNLQPVGLTGQLLS